MKNDNTCFILSPLFFLSPVCLSFSFQSHSLSLSLIFNFNFSHSHKSRENKSAVPIVPSESRVYNDIDAAYEYLNNRLGISPSNLILYGRSVGSGPTCYLAHKLSLLKKPCAGVILQSPLLSAYRVAFNFRFTMIGDLFPNIDRIHEIDSPIFIIHGTRDEVVPFWHGQELFLATQKKYRARPFWVTGAGHNNVESLLRSTTAFHDHIRFFIDQWCASSQEINKAIQLS